jgi:hypothetical protein
MGGKDGRKRIGLVLSGGGARGAYEAGVLAHVLEEIYPRLPAGFEFDVVSGTSVGAIHAAYMAASAHLEPATRSKQLRDTWHGMQASDVLRLSVGDLMKLPFRALGATRLSRRLRSGAEVIGGLVDIAPLERLVQERIPWRHLRANLERSTPGFLLRPEAVQRNEGPAVSLAQEAHQGREADAGVLAEAGLGEDRGEADGVDPHPAPAARVGAVEAVHGLQHPVDGVAGELVVEDVILMRRSWR